MEGYSYTLEQFSFNQQERYIKIISLLNKQRRWETVVHKLGQFRIPIHLSDKILEKMTLSKSPSQILLLNLVHRSCTVAHLSEVLKECEFFDVSSILSGSDILDIKVHPGESDELIKVKHGEELKLECYAEGYPLPSYQWYFFNMPIVECTKPTLVITQFGEKHEGEYFCMVSHHRDNKYCEKASNTVVCQLLEILPEFLQQLPMKKIASIGSDILLFVETNVRCKLQWVKDNVILEDENNTFLKVSDIKKSHAGEYRCIASNSIGEVFSTGCDLQVLSPSQVLSPATAKVALLIGNGVYKNYSELNTPLNDVIALACILQKLNFHVVTLINLSLVEMKNAIEWFYTILPEGAYALFYYVGHGFEMYNNKFMMPVDCPDSKEFLMANCLCDQLVIQMAMKSKPTFLVIILDMCLKLPNRECNPKIFEERAQIFDYSHNKCGTVQAYATSSHQNAYERKEGNIGMYMECLCKYLESDEKLVSVLQNAHGEFSRLEVGKKQKPTLSFNDCQRFKLTDPVIGDHNLNQKILEMYKLPSDHQLIFPQIGVCSILQVRPHKDLILNTIDLIFSKDLISTWTVTAEVNPEIVGDQYSWSLEGDILTLYNVQKAKSDIVITVKLNDNMTSKIVDLCLVDLGTPLIAGIKLWFQQTNDLGSA